MLMKDHEGSWSDKGVYGLNMLNCLLNYMEMESKMKLQTYP